MKSSSLKLVAAGIKDPSHYRDNVIHTWHLQEDYQKNLEVFMLKQTTRTQLFDHTKDGELYVHEKKYSITWINSPNAINKHEHDRLLLSFRYCKNLDRGYVLVKILHMGQFDELEY